MKKILTLYILFISIVVNAQLDTINTGSGPGTGDGDPGRIAFQKVNSSIKQVNNNTENIDSLFLLNSLDSLRLDSLITEIKLSDSIINTNTEVYISPTGSDLTGDGTLLNPFQTISKAFSGITFISNSDYTVNLAAGTYDWNETTSDEISQITYKNSSIYFIGSVETIETSIISTESANPCHYNSSKTGLTVTEDQYLGYFIADGNAHYPITWNSSGTNTFEMEYARSGRSGTRNIVNTDAVIQVEDDFTLDIRTIGNPVITFEKTKIQYSGILRFLETNCKWFFDHATVFEVSHLILGNFSNGTLGNFAFRDCFINASGSYAACEIRTYTGNFTLARTGIYSSSVTGSLMNVSSPYVYIELANVLFRGNSLSQALRLGSSSQFILTSGSIFRDLDIVFNNFDTWGKVTSYELDGVSIYDCNYLFYGQSIGTELDLTPLYTDGNLTSIFQTGENIFVNPAQHNNITIPGLFYPEIEIGYSYTLPDNTTGNLVVGDFLYNKFIEIKATFSRGTSNTNAVIRIDPENLNIWVDWYPIDAGFGLTFNNVNLNGNNIQLNYTTSSTGQSIIMKTNINRINR